MKRPGLIKDGGPSERVWKWTAEHREWNRERMRRLRATPEFRHAEIERQRRSDKAKAMLGDALRCFNPECIRIATTEIERGFATESGIVLRRVPYCGVC